MSSHGYYDSQGYYYEQPASGAQYSGSHYVTEGSGSQYYADQGSQASGSRHHTGSTQQQSSEEYHYHGEKRKSKKSRSSGSESSRTATEGSGKKSSSGVGSWYCCYCKMGPMNYDLDDRCWNKDCQHWNCIKYKQTGTAGCVVTRR